MKKIYLLFVIMMMSIFSISAQSIIMNFTTHGIVLGDDEYKYFDADTTGFDPGTGGANHTWTFTGLDIGTMLHTQTYIDPATTPYASSFPTATYAQETSGLYAYYKSNSSGTWIVGVASSTVTLPYPDDEKMFYYPFTYLNTFSDYFSGEAIIGNLKYKRFGQITTTGDGWGKIIINGTTYNNVLRVKIVQTINDYAINLIDGDTTGATLTETTNYHWYRQNNKEPIINYTFIKQIDLFDIWPTIINKMIFVDNDVTGINDHSSDQVNVVVYPNPTSNYVNLETSYTNPQKLNIEVANTNGQVVYSDLISVKAGSNVQKLDVSKLQKGIYTIRMFNNESVAVRKLILQ